MNSVAYTCELLWKMCVYVCVCVRSHDHTHLKIIDLTLMGLVDCTVEYRHTLTGTLYITSLPTTLNWALSHSHLFHPMQTSQNTEKMSIPNPPGPPPPSHLAIWATLVRNVFSSTQRNVQRNPQYTVCIDTISPLGNNLINKMYRPATEMQN